MKKKEAVEALQRSLDYLSREYPISAAREVERAIEVLTQPEQEWQDMSTAPRDKRLLVRTDRETYCAHWAKSPYTDDEAWVVAEWGDEGEQALVYPIEWRFIE